jgi:hypothetical protein
MIHHPSFNTMRAGVLVTLCLFVGCDSGHARLVLDLKRTGLAYHSFHTDNENKGPGNWNELIDYSRKANLFPESLEHVRDAGYTVTWSVQFDQMKKPLSQFVLAKPPSTGPTLMMDGGVRE